jgi:hypothetical protein
MPSTSRLAPTPPSVASTQLLSWMPLLIWVASSARPSPVDQVVEPDVPATSGLSVTVAAPGLPRAAGRAWSRRHRRRSWTHSRRWLPPEATDPAIADPDVISWHRPRPLGRISTNAKGPEMRLTKALTKAAIVGHPGSRHTAPELRGELNRHVVAAAVRDRPTAGGLFPRPAHPDGEAARPTGRSQS